MTIQECYNDMYGKTTEHRTYCHAKELCNAGWDRAKCILVPKDKPMSMENIIDSNNESGWAYGE